VIEQRAGGVIHIRAGRNLARYHDKLSQTAEHWARVRPTAVSWRSAMRKANGASSVTRRRFPM
jgi:hypothetical protein